MMKENRELSDTLLDVIRDLNRNGIAYAVCGGLAMALHGYPRATMDIDLLIEEGAFPQAVALAKKRGFTHDSGEMRLGEGRIRLHRLVMMLDAGREPIPLDLIMATPMLSSIWKCRVRLEVMGEPIWILDREGLIAMKSLRGSGTDMDDIEKLKGDDDSTIG